MKIHLSPQRRDEPLELVKQGDTLTVNGTLFNFAPVSEGATLPLEAISSDLFCGPVERVNGELVIHMILPHGSNPSQEQAFPGVLDVTRDGPIELPKDTVQESEQ